jgi:hypothetical protein
MAIAYQLGRNKKEKKKTSRPQPWAQGGTHDLVRILNKVKGA